VEEPLLHRLRRRLDVETATRPIAAVAVLAHRCADHLGHKAVIDAVRAGSSPPFATKSCALVVKVAPAFEAHMLAAQNLEKQLAAGATK
jgi:hypothetical protein